MCVTEKRMPHCKLTLVRALVEQGKVRTTQSARIGATQLGLELADMLDMVIGGGDSTDT
jgi:motility quorum-sensing regulator / GCU-specific mRNA interferase toxin